MIRLIFNRVTIIVLLLALSGWFYWRQRHESTPDSILKGTVERQDIIQRVTISGVIAPNRTATLNAPYNGYINKIFVRIGQKVKRGDPIITVTQTPDGSGQDTFPLRAPFAGQVMQILKEEGADVKESSDASGLVRIDDTSKLFVESDTAEMDFPKLSYGQEAVIKASSLPDRTYHGKIISMYQAAKAQDRWDRSRVEFPIRIEIIDLDSNLKPGMSVTMDIITAEVKNALSLRHDFVGRDAQGYYVVLENGDRKDIKIGMRSEDAFELTDGVAEGQSVLQVDFLANSNAGPIRGRKPGRRR